MIGPGLMPGPFLEIRRRFLGAGFGSRGYRNQVKFNTRQIACPFVQSATTKIRAQPGTLQVRVGAQMDVPTEHSSAHQCNRYFFGVSHSRSNVCGFSLLSQLCLHLSNKLF